MKQPNLILREEFRSEKEAERAQNLQQLLETCLSLMLEAQSDAESRRDR